MFQARMGMVWGRLKKEWGIVTLMPDGVLKMFPYTIGGENDARPKIRNGVETTYRPPGCL